jgi:predicted enzyme related to lactoylglutathione lyase/mannose-6-phosphate isomerase-like protein (cupin superfamily)
MIHSCYTRDYMDVKKIVSELKKQYPGKKIIFNNQKTPTEIICELDLVEKPMGSYSTSVSVIEQTKPHYYQKSAVIYYVLKGKLELIVEDKRYYLSENKYHVVLPGKVHFTKGKATSVLVYAEPAISKEDCFEVKKEQPIFLPNLGSIRLLAENYPLMFAFYHQTLGLPIKNKQSNKEYAEFEAGDCSIIIQNKLLLPKAVLSSLSGKNRAIVISLKVDNLESAAKVLLKKDIPLLTSPAKYASMGISAFYLNDPEGNLLEIYSSLE